MKTRVEIKGPVAHILMDDPDKKVNTLGGQMIAELGNTLDSLSINTSVKAIVIRSGKPGVFLAGADIDELREIAKSGNAYEGGLNAARVGQVLMNKIADYRKPVVAAVHGACLGGGLELALACHSRVASFDPATKLGLPELKLGIVPGFGGTYRLPRLLGLIAGMEAILSSKTFDGRQALKASLVDDLCAPEQLAEVADELAQKLLDEKFKAQWMAKRKRPPLMLRIMQMPGLRQIVFLKAQAQVMEKTKGQYPAPLCFLKMLSSHYGHSRESHLEAEAKVLAETLQTRVATNLIRLFFLGQDVKKQVGDATARRVSQVGIVGAGLMGSGIAIPLIDKAGVRTALKDTNEAMIGKALKKAWDYEVKRLKRRQVDETEARARYYQLSASTQWGGFQQVEMVIEAVPEILELKQKIFAELESVVPQGTILASNTSTLPIHSLSEKAKHPERFVGMHFFSPAEVMPLVEVIPSSRTLPEVVATTVELSRKMGKTPIVVKDSPGFLVNRILLPYALEAAQMVEEGVPVEEVDGAAVRFGMPMGPIRLVGEVGVEVMIKVMHQMKGVFGEHMADPKWVERADIAQAFHKGSDGKWSVDSAKVASWIQKPNPGYSSKDIEDRLFHAMLNESVRCLEEGIVPDPGLVDLGMVYGTGFPPYRGGPCSEADARGLEAVVQRGKELAVRFGSRFEPTELLIQKSKSKTNFYA